MTNTQGAGRGAQHSIAPPAMSPEGEPGAAALLERDHRRDTHVDIDIEAEFALELGAWLASGDAVEDFDAIELVDDGIEIELDDAGSEQTRTGRSAGGGP